MLYAFNLLKQNTLSLLSELPLYHMIVMGCRLCRIMRQDYYTFRLHNSNAMYSVHHQVYRMPYFVGL